MNSSSSEQNFEQCFYDYEKFCQQQDEELLFQYSDEPLDQTFDKNFHSQSGYQFEQDVLIDVPSTGLLLNKIRDTHYRKSMDFSNAKVTNAQRLFQYMLYKENKKGRAKVFYKKRKKSSLRVSKLSCVTSKEDYDYLV